MDDQERAVGRTKLGNVELPDETKPSNSHVALTVIEDDRGERQILRLNMPFGKVGTGEFGTYFIGYARSPDVVEQMLHNMFVGVPAGNHDRILDFSQAVTGKLFFAPTEDFLEDPDAWREARAAGPGAGAQQPESAADGSLGMGGMRPR